jgi:creatinine amidohydrolase
VSAAEFHAALGVDDQQAHGELETSVLLAVYPDYVRDGWDTTDHSATDRRYLPALGMSAYTGTGVIGQPSQATREKGLGVLNHLGAAAGTLIGLLTATRD